MLNFNWLPRWIQNFNPQAAKPFLPTCVLCDCNIHEQHTITYLCDICYQDLDLYPLGYDLKYHNPNAYEQIELAHVAGITAVSDYLWPMAQLLKNLKFQHKPYIARIVADLMHQQLKHLPWPTLDRICPVPLHPSRLAERGYNQAEVICDYLTPKLHLTPYQGLKRLKKTQPQTDLNRTQRKLNLRDAFVSQQNLEGQKILLVDDVMTTGTTLKQASDALIKSGADEVYIAVAAIRVF